MNDIAIDKEHLHYLEQLSEMYPTIGKASSEIINLQAILNLPKGTEHFVSDVHGEYEAFSHVLKNGSGAVRKKIDDVFGLAMDKADKAALATLIYYPREKMELIKQDEPDMDSWYKTTLYKLIEVCKTVSSKYTRSKVRKALPEEYAYVIEELITEKPEVLNKEAYYESIINTTVELGTAEEFIVVLSELIQRLAVDHLHVLGDIYDRGAGPHLIMDRLCRYHSLDIQWGNHDIIWMGAAAGNPACIATVVRNSIRYGNLDVVEEGYGINMLPLATFALKAYKDDPCTRFVFKVAPSGADNMESDLIKKMHKAIAIIRFKLEGQLIKKWPEYGMKERLLLEHIDYEQGTIELEGRTYKLLDTSFPTIDPADPYRLTDSASGWFDQGCGDIRSIHDYFFPLHVTPEKRVTALTEFGGYSLQIPKHSMYEKKVYGYKKFKRKRELTAGYEKLIKKLIIPNISRGLSATVYTQLSDIEEEVNGILSYDRKIVKIDENVVREWNDKLHF